MWDSPVTEEKEGSNFNACQLEKKFPWNLFINKVQLGKFLEKLAGCSLTQQWLTNSLAASLQQSLNLLETNEFVQRI